MKKTILSIAVLLASVAGINATAQTPATKSCPNTAQCTKGTAKKDAPKYNPFAGLNLTEKQQSELQALKPSKEQMTQKKEAAKAEKQAQRQQRMEQKLQNRRDYLAKVKTILTPDQYLQFLENSYVDQSGKKGPRQTEMAKGKAGKRGGNAQAMRGNKGRKDGVRADKGRKDGRGSKDGKMLKQGKNNSASNADTASYYIDNGLIKVFPYQAQK